MFTADGECQKIRTSLIVFHLNYQKTKESMKTHICCLCANYDDALEVQNSFSSLPF